MARYFSATLATEAAGQVTAQVGGAATVLAGTPVCTSGVLSEQSSGLTILLWYEIVSRGFSLPFSIPTVATNNIYWCVDSSQNGYAVLIAAGANASRIVRLDAGVEAATLLTWTAADGDDYVLTVPRTGPFTLSQNGGAAMTATADATHNGDGFGFAVNNGGEIEGPITMSAVGATTLAELLQKPNATPVYLVETTAAQHLKKWISDGSGYDIAYTLSPSAVYFDGAALTEYASRAAADSAGRGWVDESGSGGELYVVLDGGDTPFTGAVVALIPFYFSTAPKIFNSQYFEARVASLPNLSLRVEPTFGGVAQIGGGSLSFENADGYFNGLSDLRWDAGTSTIRMGVDYKIGDGSTVEMAYDEYEVVATFRNGDPDYTESSFILALSEYKTELRAKVPQTFFSRDNYPLLLDRHVGRPKPLAYGQIYAAEPVCVNTVTRTFIVAGHAIHSFGEIRYLDGDSNAWTPITPDSTDTSTATFVLPSTWNGQDRVVVDFIGKKTASGYPMVNPSDVVKDILTTIGESANINTTSFTAAAAYFEYGTTPDTGQPAVSQRISLYIDSLTEALTAISRINETVGSYLYSDANGQFYYKAFEPETGESLTTLTSKEIVRFGYSPASGGILTSILVRYSRRLAQNWGRIYQYSNDTAKYAKRSNASRPDEVTLPITEERDAEYWAQRKLLVESSAPTQLYQLEVPWLGVERLPASYVHVVYTGDGFNIDGIFEVIERSIDLLGGLVKLTLGNLHGFASCGFIVDDAATLPSRFSTLTGYGSGSLVWNSSWDDEIKTWALQNVAYVTNENGYADATDPDSFQPSRII